MMPASVASAPPAERVAPAEREERAAPAKRGKAFAIAIAAGVVIAAAVGFLVGGSGGKSSSGGTPTVAADTADFAVKVPPSWARQATAPSVPGLTLADPVAIGPKDGRDAVLIGTVKSAADNSTLLPAELIKAAGRVPDRSAVKVGGVQAYRYENVSLGGHNVTLFAAPTSAGVATLACVTPAADAAAFKPQCDAVANTIALKGAKGFPVGPSATYAKAVADTMASVNKADAAGQAALKRAKAPADMAGATAATAKAYSNAAAKLGGLELSPADKSITATLVAALNKTGTAYGKAAAAARKKDSAGFRKQSAAVKAGKAAIADALSRIKAAGYEVQS
jgi:hypothetical protein